MKNLILIIFLLGAAFAVKAQEKKQSLKDLLYGGKLKKDSTGVIRSTDDLSKKIDTNTKIDSQPVTTNLQAANPQQGTHAVVSKTDANANVTTTGVDTVTAKADT